MYCLEVAHWRRWRRWRLKKLGAASLAGGLLLLLSLVLPSALVSAAGEPVLTASRQSNAPSASRRPIDTDSSDTLENLRDDRGSRNAPLLRSGRAQYCLKELGFYNGEIHGRRSASTKRALRRFRKDNGVSWGDDEFANFELHGELWDQCKDGWQEEVTKAKQQAIRDGTAKRLAAASDEAKRKGRLTSARGAALAFKIVPGGGSSGLKPPARRPKIESSFCLPEDLRDILQRAHGRREIKTCALACLPRPEFIDAEDASYYKNRWDFEWCNSCVAISSYLPLDDILKLERAGHITLCSTPRRMAHIQNETTGRILQSSALGLRRVIAKTGNAYKKHNDIAVLVGNISYGGVLPRKGSAVGDLAGFYALLTERLGYRAENIIEIRNAKLSELEALFGSKGSGEGTLAKHVQAAKGASVMIYISTYGAVSREQGEAYLLPVDVVERRDLASYYPLEVLYDNVTQLGARHTTVILEVDFSHDPGAMVLSPNTPLDEVRTLPRRARADLTIMTAADRDQHSLEDPEFGSGLFTRYLIEGLSGQADMKPLGNGNGVVDSAEAFVFAAYRTSMAARKSFGVMQRPGHSFTKAVVLGTVVDRR